MKSKLNITALYQKNLDQYLILCQNRETLEESLRKCLINYLFDHTNVKLYPVHVLRLIRLLTHLRIYYLFCIIVLINI